MSAAAGFFCALELVKDPKTRKSFSDEETDMPLGGFMSPALFERGVTASPTTEATLRPASG